MQNSQDKKLVNFDPLHFEPNSQETEIELCNFYGNRLKWIYKVSDSNFDEIRKSLGNIRSYRNPAVEVHEITSFDELFDRCAYVFAYCNIHSIVMYDRFSAMLKSNPSMLQTLTSMKKVKLCILGGGPAFEAVSICKLLSNILVTFGTSECPPLQVYVTVIDVCAGWETDAECILSSVQNELCAKNNVEVHFSFIEADLTEDFSQDMKKAIKNAHFVTMFKFLSEVGESSYKKSDVGVLVQRVIEAMSFKACLFYLDNSGGGVFKRMDKLIENLPCTSRIYGPCLHNCHQLSLESIEKYFVVTRHMFRFLKCTAQTTVSCSAWLKVRNTVNVSELSMGIVSTPVKIDDFERLELKEKRPKVKVKKMLQSPAKLSKLLEANSSNRPRNY